MPKAAEPWSLTSPREKLIKIGAKVGCLVPGLLNCYGRRPSEWSSSRR